MIKSYKLKEQILYYENNRISVEARCLILYLCDNIVFNVGGRYGIDTPIVNITKELITKSGLKSRDFYMALRELCALGYLQVYKGYNLYDAKSLKLNIQFGSKDYHPYFYNLEHDLVEIDQLESYAPGFVYLMYDREGVCKIGMTTKKVKTRLSQIRHETGDSEINVAWAIWCDNAIMAERKLHTYFQDCRLPDYKGQTEWFTLIQDDLFILYETQKYEAHQFWTELTGWESLEITNRIERLKWLSEVSDPKRVDELNNDKEWTDSGWFFSVWNPPEIKLTPDGMKAVHGDNA